MILQKKTKTDAETKYPLGLRQVVVCYMNLAIQAWIYDVDTLSTFKKRVSAFWLALRSQLPVDVQNIEGRARQPWRDLHAVQ
jgi:hypothetical protein